MIGKTRVDMMVAMIRTDWNLPQSHQEVFQELMKMERQGGISYVDLARHFNVSQAKALVETSRNKTQPLPEHLFNWGVHDPMQAYLDTLDGEEWAKANPEVWARYLEQDGRMDGHQAEAARLVGSKGSCERPSALDLPAPEAAKPKH